MEHDGDGLQSEKTACRRGEGRPGALQRFSTSPADDRNAGRKAAHSENLSAARQGEFLEEHSTEASRAPARRALGSLGARRPLERLGPAARDRNGAEEN